MKRKPSEPQNSCVILILFWKCPFRAFKKIVSIRRLNSKHSLIEQIFNVSVNTLLLYKCIFTLWCRLVRDHSTVERSNREVETDMRLKLTGHPGVTCHYLEEHIILRECVSSFKVNTLPFLSSSRVIQDVSCNGQTPITCWTHASESGKERGKLEPVLI